MCWGLGRGRWAKNLAVREDVNPHRGQDHDNREPHTPIFMVLATRLLLLLVTMIVMVMARIVVVLIHEARVPSSPV